MRSHELTVARTFGVALDDGVVAAHVFEDLPAEVPADPAAELDEDVCPCPSALPR